MVSAKSTPTSETIAVYSWLRDSSYEDDVWHIVTDNAKLCRRATTKISFAQPIGQGGLLLTDRAAANDLTTIKRLLVAGMSGETRWLGSGLSARWFLRQVITFVRWRRGIGLDRTSALTPVWFEHYIERLSAGGVGGLLDSEGRIRTAIADLEGASDDFRLKSEWLPTNHYDVGKVLAFAGLSSTWQLDDNAKSAIRAHAAQRGLSLSHRPAFKGLEEQATPNERPGDKLAILTFNNHLKVWEQLWLHRELLSHDPLQFAPFGADTTPYKIARSLTARRPEKVPTPPAEQTCFLIDRAIRWVTRYAGPLIQLGELLREDQPNKVVKTPIYARRDALRRCIAALEKELEHDGPGAPWPLGRTSYHPGRDTSSLSVRSALFECLPGACAIILAAFTARRAGEIESLRRGCITESPHGLILESYIEKSLRTIDTIPVPPIVADAIAALEWISEGASDETQWLFAFRDILPNDKGEAKSFSIDLRRCLVKFGEHVGVPPLLSGEHWHFTPHQFRRFFAVSYYYRFKFRSLDALSYFLRHSSIDVTRGYVTETTPGSYLRLLEDEGIRAETPNSRSAVRSSLERRSDFEAVGQEFREERLGAVARGLEPIGGFGGAKLSRELSAMIGQTRSKLRLVDGGSEEEINRVVTELASRTVLDPHPDGHSYCACPNTAGDIAVAECAKLARAFDPKTEAAAKAPDHRYASDLVCARCPHNVQFSENCEYWTGLAERPLKDRGTLIDARDQERARVARDVLSAVQMRGLS